MNSDTIKINLKDKKFLVTGGAGFIGSEVVKQLLEKGSDVTILDNFSSGKKQYLPTSKKLKIFKGDIQDEKILGTCHVATGRSDHLGGNLTPELFNSRQNASHDDILYAPPKTPEISVTSVHIQKNGQSHKILQDFVPTPYLLNLLAPEYPVDLIADVVPA